MGVDERFIAAKMHERCKKVQLPRKTVKWFLKTTQNYHMIQFYFHLQVYAPKNKKQGLKQILRRPLFTVALFTIAKRQKQPKGPSE